MGARGNWDGTPYGSNHSYSRTLDSCKSFSSSWVWQFVWCRRLAFCPAGVGSISNRDYMTSHRNAVLTGGVTQRRSDEIDTAPAVRSHCDVLTGWSSGGWVMQVVPPYNNKQIYSVSRDREEKSRGILRCDCAGAYYQNRSNPSRAKYQDKAGVAMKQHSIIA